MGKLIKIFCLTVFMILPGARCFAQYPIINTDIKTIRQVGINTAAIEAAETAHNLQVDTIKKKQSKLMTIITGIRANRELFHEVKKNVKGFGAESKIYKRMYTVSGEILTNSVKAIGLVKKSKLVQKAVALSAVYEVVTKAIQTGQMFSDIVTNSKVENPVSRPGHTVPKSKGDGFNILNRDERLAMANNLLYKLEELNRQLYRICVLAKYSTVRDLVALIDAKSWYKYLAAKSTCNDLIDKWNALSNYHWSF